jgi:hypothetical protein
MENDYERKIRKAVKIRSWTDFRINPVMFGGAKGKYNNLQPDSGLRNER